MDATFCLPILALVSLWATSTPLHAADDGCIQDLESGRSLPDCRVIDADHLQLSARMLASLDYDQRGLAAVMATGPGIQPAWHYVRREGRQIHALTYDNGPDCVVEGLVRGLVNGRVGYFDIQLRPAFAQLFDFGFPFEKGIALVCNGCRSVAADGDEHHVMEGGQWFQIDTQGRVLHSIDAPDR